MTSSFTLHVRSSLQARGFFDSQLDRSWDRNPRTPKRVKLQARGGRYFFLPFAFFFSSTTACAAANREIGTRKGDALT